ncbi:hypothetical protein [Facilibium subflavum]|uniref:hypothetical protein n=1 Tax=Facilibium subflavum TaxID=2219058 RepID=UPI000E65A4D9|nr:hypothetical protein [Facilibium subflavum]
MTMVTDLQSVKAIVNQFKEWLSQMPGGNANNASLDGANTQLDSVIGRIQNHDNNIQQKDHQIQNLELRNQLLTLQSQYWDGKKVHLSTSFTRWEQVKRALNIDPSQLIDPDKLQKAKIVFILIDLAKRETKCSDNSLSHRMAQEMRIELQGKGPKVALDEAIRNFCSDDNKLAVRNQLKVLAKDPKKMNDQQIEALAELVQNPVRELGNPHGGGFASELFGNTPSPPSPQQPNPFD